MTTSSREQADTYVGEDEVIGAGRARAAEVGTVPVSPGSGGALRLLAAAINARAVVEIGTGTGVSGVWMLRGMAPGGILTTIDTEAEHQRLARATFADEGIAPARVRAINGRGLDVLPRLADAAYDLMFCDAVKTEYADYLSEALRLLRPGGVVAFDNVLARGKVAEPSARDPETVALREFGRMLREQEGLVSALLPVGDGLLAAVARPSV